uniref:Uncharacterized protein n=1 Tax=Eikenella corrodens TaxID=539 RepID=A0A1A9RCW6_EIKCO|nr:hypothetical protein A7P90_10415 [Eikenella corrodens]
MLRHQQITLLLLVQALKHQVVQAQPLAMMPKLADGRLWPMVVLLMQLAHLRLQLARKPLLQLAILLQSVPRLLLMWVQLPLLLIPVQLLVLVLWL